MRGGIRQAAAYEGSRYRGHGDLRTLVLTLLVSLFVLSLFTVGVLLINLPATYFQDDHRRQLWAHRHPLTRLLLHLVKNLIGVGIVLAGGAFLVLGIPGQAVVTILLGVMLLDFPGKVRLERRLVRSPWLLERVNRLRGDSTVRHS